ncbi:hypothetical protein TCARB_1491 [Thermofilum adornatum 1505]|uniref:Uncharacterized protein n=1 Tax=Thermofilum adornatum 1505 TaxID=697581 RepID=A0A3G1A8I5_9CREN|nr:hypothetical protein TCARB_1491 [Thermofilum adornatum 1505]
MACFSTTPNYARVSYTSIIFLPRILDNSPADFKLDTPSTDSTYTPRYKKEKRLSIHCIGQKTLQKFF